jgi:hypothetical protein
MDMKSRNQYLKELRTEYLKNKSKKKRGELLDEAEKRTKLNRKYLMNKLKPKGNLDRQEYERKKRTQYYDNSIKPTLVKVWQIFDNPCGQRLEPLLKSEVERLRVFGELNCSNEIANKLTEMGSSTIDRKLKHQKQIELAKKKYCKKIHPLLYQKIPVKVFVEQDRSILGNIQIDLVEHCGASAAGQFVNTLSATDIYSGWTEEMAIIGKGQEPTKEGIDKARSRFPFDWKEIHSDGGTEFINAHLFQYSLDTHIQFSRSRPYKKNDNCLVEQKNFTHVRKLVGYLRYDTIEELDLLNDIYSVSRLFKNFFQPVIKLVLKERVGGRLYRKYDKPRTPYQRVLESSEVSDNKKRTLTATYLSLNPAELKRLVDKKLDILYQFYKQKVNSQKVDQKKRISVRFSEVSREPVSVR